MGTKALLLLSGGLDSTLALRLLQEEGIELEALNFVTPFCRCTKQGCRHQASLIAAEFNVRITVVSKGAEYLSVVKNPKFGRGSGMNPCIDCRIFSLRKARERMEEIGASFIVTGEVLGQRPMSQHRNALCLIEKEAGVEGLVYRPLSAKLLSATVPEERGWVDREKALAISGRSRKEQIRLAAHLDVKDYPCPAGGCLLTDPGFSARLRDLLERRPEADMNDVKLLKYGRHFWSNGTKIVVGRSEKDNNHIANLSRAGDTVMTSVGYPGPLALLRGVAVPLELIKKAAELTAYYGRAKAGRKAVIQYGPRESQERQTIEVKPERPASLTHVG